MKFECEVCKGTIELKKYKQYLGKQIVCPHNCGANYVLWINPELNKPELFCVVKPIYDFDDNNDDDEDFDFEEDDMDVYDYNDEVDF